MDPHFADLNNIVDNVDNVARGPGRLALKNLLFSKDIEIRFHIKRTSVHLSPPQKKKMMREKTARYNQSRTDMKTDVYLVFFFDFL